MLYQPFPGEFMSIVKIVLRKKKNQQGLLPDLLPLTLRITKDRKTSFIYLGHSIKESDWDDKTQRVKKTHLNSARLNNFLIAKLAEANDKALELEAVKDAFSVKAVKNKIKPKAGSTFFAQADSYLGNLKLSGKYNQYTSDKSRINNFKKFVGGDIAFSDITPSLLDRFKSYARVSLHLNERSSINQLVSIRSVFSQAIKDNVIDSKHYPFGRGKMKIKFPDSVKIGLTLEEIKQLENIKLEDPQENHARNLWLISFYFAGMRISDVLLMKWSQLRDSRLHYTMEKNNKVVSLKIPVKAIKILDQYKGVKRSNDDLIFPELKDCDLENKFITQRTIAFKVSAIDKCLRLHVAPEAKIEKKLTMHIARHSFAQNATNIDVRTLQKLFRHTKLETTEGYMGQFVHQAADDALDLVLAYEPTQNEYKKTPKNSKKALAK